MFTHIPVYQLGHQSGARANLQHLAPDSGIERTPVPATSNPRCPWHRRALLSFALSLLPIVALAQQTNVAPGGPAPRTTAATKMLPLRLGTNAAGARASAPPLSVGSVAPDFVSKNLAGKDVRLADWRNKIVVLDFWATWCGPCKASLPHTQEVAKRFKDQGVVVLAVCTSDTRAKFEEFVKANQEKYPDIVFTCDPNDRGSETFNQRASSKFYKVSGIPTQFVIGRDGKVNSVLVGYKAGESRLEAALAKLGIKTEAADKAKAGS